MKPGWLVAGVLAVGCHSTPGPASPDEQLPSSSAERTKPEPRGRIVVTDTLVEVLDPITFLSGSTTLDPRSSPILDAIAATMNGNPSIKLVAVHAYGADALVQFQAQIGADRAQVIVDQLVARGVSRSRLVAQGDAAPGAGNGTGPSLEILKRE